MNFKDFIFVLFQSGVSISYGTFMFSLSLFLALARYNFLQFAFYCYQFNNNQSRIESLFYYLAIQSYNFFPYLKSFVTFSSALTTNFLSHFFQFRVSQKKSFQGHSLFHSSVVIVVVLLSTDQRPLAFQKFSFRFLII